jgi:Transposase IS4
VDAHEIEIAAESYEEENGNFNEFGAPDPLGVPIAEVLAEPIVVIPDSTPAVEAAKWTDVPIETSTDELIGRRGNKKLSMIPNFLGRKAGHQNIPPHIAQKPSPASFFFLFMNFDIVEQFVEATNSYAEMIDTKNWKKLTNKEFLAFVVIIVFMGVVKLPERTMYWQKDSFGQDFPKEIMSSRRFEQILAHWHWIVVPEDKRAEAKKADPFYLVEGFVEGLAKIAQHYWKLDQFIDIDEMSIYYKGRHKCRCYNPNKPEKWHFKAFCLNDGRTGYLWNFYLYRGASEVREEGWSATAYPIKKLTETFTNIHHKGKNYVMCTDNWYTSFEIAEYLMTTYGVHLIGTIKLNRSGIPKNRIFLDKGRNKKQRGEMNMAKTRINGHDYYFTSWMDSRPVHGLSTLPTTKSTVQRKIKERPDAPFRTVLVPRPDMWKWYNLGMGGTDLHDQFNKYYRTTVRCNKWPIRIFTHFSHHVSQMRTYYTRVS